MSTTQCVIARTGQEKNNICEKSLEEAHIRVRKRPPKQEEHQREGNGTTKSSQGRQAQQQGKQRRAQDHKAQGGDLEVGHGVQLVGMNQGDLEGYRGMIEDVEDSKAQVLLVGGERRVRVNKWKLRIDVDVERVEVLPPDFAEVGLQAQLGVTPGATKEEVKAVYKKMVLKLHLDKDKNNREKATELFKRLNSAHENRRNNGTPAGQVWNNQPAPQPHYTNFQFNPTYFRSNF